MKWQYKTLRYTTSGMRVDFDEKELEKTMNQLGGEQWELVTALDTNVIQGQTKELVFIFKKPA